MADRIDKKTRSEVMSKIRSRDTKPELEYKSKNPKLQYQPKLFGNPDFIDWRNKKIIFIDGCFWHKCPEHYKSPKTNKKYWIPKLERNVIRAKEVEIAYKGADWKIIRIWEHDLRKK